MTLWIEIVAGLFWFIYASFFEWFVHRHLMHARHIPFQDAFRGHTLGHHQNYRWDKSFQTHASGRPKDVTLRWYAFPGMLLFHLPFLCLFQWLTGLPTFWGAVAGLTMYYVGYEYTHYAMHVPRHRHVERLPWFRFLREHHRLHHKYMLRNLNVFVPLADVCFGTLITAEGWRSKPSKRRRELERRQKDKRAVGNHP